MSRPCERADLEAQIAQFSYWSPDDEGHATELIFEDDFSLSAVEGYHCGNCGTSFYPDDDVAGSEATIEGAWQRALDHLTATAEVAT